MSKRDTWCIPHMFGVSKSNSHRNAENHEKPVDLGNVDLTMYFIRSMNNLDPWKATKWLALVDDWESPTDDCLASYHWGKDGNHKHRPSYTFCKWMILAIYSSLLQKRENIKQQDSCSTEGCTLSYGFHINCHLYLHNLLYGLHNNCQNNFFYWWHALNLQLMVETMIAFQLCPTSS